MRVTKSWLNSRVVTLNLMLERPGVMFNAAGKHNIGHLVLDKNAAGYLLDEITSENGTTHNISGRLSASEMSLFLSGLIAGVALRNRHITELMIRNELVKSGLTSPTATLYNQDVSQLEN